MTKPLTLIAMLLLTVIALAAGYMAFGQKQDADAKRSAEIQACVKRVAYDDPSAVRAVCLGR